MLKSTHQDLSDEEATYFGAHWTLVIELLKHGHILQILYFGGFEWDMVPNLLIFAQEHCKCKLWTCSYPWTTDTQRLNHYFFVAQNSNPNPKYLFEMWI